MYCLAILFACRPPHRRCNSDELHLMVGLCAAPLSLESVTHNHWLQPVAPLSERSRFVAAFQPAFLLISQLVAQCYNR